jgi:hypothetical protein
MEGRGDPVGLGIHQVEEEMVSHPWVVLEEEARQRPAEAVEADTAVEEGVPVTLTSAQIMEVAEQQAVEAVPILAQQHQIQ